MRTWNKRSHGTESSWRYRLYVLAMGVPDQQLLADADPDFGVSLRDVLYYAYQKGFWAFLRGLLFRPRLRQSGPRLFVGRHARILFPRHLSVGGNVALGDYTFLSCIGRQGVHLGSNVRIREFGWVQVTSHLTRLGEGVTVGDNTYIGPHALIGAGAGVVIGRNVALGAYVQLLGEDHEFADGTLPINQQGVRRRGIRIADDCWLGNNVIVLDGVSIGSHTVIGAGSVVTHDVPSNCVAVGNPARVIRTLDGKR
jgi:acetyltransferase-like isoleucine patch superfamily enzyme